MHHTDPAAYVAAQEWLSTFEDFSEDSTDESDLFDAEYSSDRNTDSQHVSEYWRKYSNPHASTDEYFLSACTIFARRCWICSAFSSRMYQVI